MATSQPLDRLEFAEKEIVRYKEDLDEWKQKHEQLVNYWSPIEDFVPKAIYLYEFITRQGKRLHERALEQREDLVPEIYVRNRLRLKEWLTLSLLVQDELRSVAAEYIGELPDAAKLATCIEQARSRIDSPRPVKIDDDGRIFEMNGEQFIMSGLEPENVLSGLEDERAGRTRSLNYRFSQDETSLVVTKIGFREYDPTRPL